MGLHVISRIHNTASRSMSYSLQSPITTICKVSAATQCKLRISAYDSVYSVIHKLTNGCCGLLYWVWHFSLSHYYIHVTLVIFTGHMIQLLWQNPQGYAKWYTQHQMKTHVCVIRAQSEKVQCKTLEKLNTCNAINHAKTTAVFCKPFAVHKR